VVGQAAAHKAGRWAKRGDYEKAQMEARSAQRYLAQNAAEEDSNAFSNVVEKLDQQLRIQKTTETLQPQTATRSEETNKMRTQQRKMNFDSASIAISSVSNLNKKKMYQDESNM